MTSGLVPVASYCERGSGRIAVGRERARQPLPATGCSYSGRRNDINQHSDAAQNTVTVRENEHLGNGAEQNHQNYQYLGWSIVRLLMM
jgi:hypothetical protein